MTCKNRKVMTSNKGKKESRRGAYVTRKKERQEEQKRRGADKKKRSFLVECFLLLLHSTLLRRFLLPFLPHTHSHERTLPTSSPYFFSMKSAVHCSIVSVGLF